jgi:class 3 adenylate cyclase/ABC-type amino acid transport substrate-binding protein
MQARNALVALTSRRGNPGNSVFDLFESKRPRTLWGWAAAAAVIVGLVSAVGPTQSLAAEPTIALTAEEKAWLDHHRLVRVMVGTWPPFHYVAEDGEHRGLALDYARQVLGELGLEIEPVPILWHDALDSIQRFEKVDLLPTIARSPEREKKVEFTREYLSFPMVIFTRRDAPFVGGMGDLRGSIVAVEKNFIMHSRLQRDHPEIDLLPVRTSRDALEAVSLGKADAYVSNLAVGVFLIQKLGFLNVKVAAPTTYEFDRQAMGVRKDWPELASMIDKVLAKMTAAQHSAFRQEALQVRFEYGVDVQQIVLWVGSIGGALAFLIFVVVAWNRRLGREIADRKQAETQLAQKTHELEGLSNKLSKYLSPQVYKSIFSGELDTKIITQRKKLTVFFSDIKDFTATTEDMEPEELTALLNDYFTKMTAIALEYGGTIDKYVGDAMLIFFGDPESRGAQEDALACVRMAIAMQRRMVDLRAKWSDMGVERPFHMRAGINTGYCDVGNFGSEQRIDYTIIGGEVNLAARLESICEPDGIVLAHETYTLVRNYVDVQELDPISVKGISRNVRPYAVTGTLKDRETSDRYIRGEQEGFRLWIDVKRMTDAEKASTAEALEAAARKLKAS